MTAPDTAAHPQAGGQAGGPDDRLRRLLRPRSIAVAGASRTPGGVGRRVLDALVRNGFEGPVFPVNPSAGHVGSLKAHPSVADIGHPVDLVVVAVPADQVIEVVHSSAKADAGALLVVTAGFAETGAGGAQRQRELAEAANGAGMRMVGPNCLGIVTTDPAVSMNASFAPEMPPAGSLALCSQSGALGIAVIDLARRLRLGLSSFVSVGNQADVSTADLVERWGAEDGTDVILLYLESFAQPRRFRDVAGRVARHKPIVMVKAGRTEAGSRAATSHTAALAGVDAAVDALAVQTGLLRAPSLHAMFDIARTVSSQPLPRGRRVAIATNSGGPGILCVDALSELGFTVDRLPGDLRRRLADRLPAEASTANPVDMVASADAAAYRTVVPELLGADEVDALVVMFTPVGIATTAEVRAAVADGVAAARRDGIPPKPVLACVVGDEQDTRELGGGDERIPSFAFPEELAAALGAVARYAEWRQRPPGRALRLAPDARDRARRPVRAALAARGPGWLRVSECRSVLAAAGIDLVPGEVVADADAAVAVADRLGYPVALSVASTDIVHKSDRGGVRLGLPDAPAVRHAHGEILAAAGRQGAAVDGVLVAAMVGGTEMLVGVDRTPDFGPLLVAGLGGTETEVLDDTAVRLTPVTDADARDMLRELRSWRLLTGYRTTPAADVDALVELVQRVSALAEAVPEIRQLDLNPVFARPSGYLVADVRIGVAEPDGAHAAGGGPGGAA